MSPSSPADTIAVAKPTDAFTDRELLEAVYQQQVNLAEQYTRVEAVVNVTLTNLGPMLEAMAKSPILKMMGIKL